MVQGESVVIMDMGRKSPVKNFKFLQEAFNMLTTKILISYSVANAVLFQSNGG